ncbi:MAG: Polyketide cyclase/dehydrase [Acidobacteria bacterium]|jgi:hypothetical protein|nr:Polyketide cyclase/dehydrase [Acidobacteriota bacterium]
MTLPENEPPLTAAPPETPVIEARPERITAAQWTLAGIIVAVAVGGALYRLLVLERLEQTASLFIALPAIIAVALALTPKAKSALGITMKGMTIALLMSGPILGEGFICILMSAPLFYLVGALVAIAIDLTRKNRRSRSGLLVVLLPMLAGLEGTSPRFTFDTREAVTSSRIVELTPAEVEQALGRTPRFTGPLPLFLRLKFPRPVAVEGSGLQPGDLRRIHFGGGEGKPGDLVVRVAQHTANSVRFTAVSDSSHIAHWLAWRESTVEWQPLDARHTSVRCTIRYDRALHPAWYFGPWERYATGLAGGYMIESLAVR